MDGQPWFRAHAGSHDRRGPAEAEVQKLIKDGYKGAWLQAVYLPRKNGCIATGHAVSMRRGFPDGRLKKISRSRVWCAWPYPGCGGNPEVSSRSGG